MKAVQNKVKAFPLYAGNSGCDYHRVRLPFMYGGDYWDSELHNDFDSSNMLGHMLKSEVIVFNRMLPFDLEQLNKYKREHGLKFVCDLDDWVELPWYHPNYKQYSGGYGEAIIGFLKACDMVIVTTDRLYDKVKPFNLNTHVVPNALPFNRGQFRPHPSPAPRTDDLFNFVYAGQSSHLEDVRIMQPAMSKIKTLNGISFTLAGFRAHSIWYKMENVFSKIPNYRRGENKELTKYMTVYDDMDCSIVPLCLNDFNACKSNLKLLEAAAKKIPVIVSHVPPYRDTPDAPVLWVKEPSDWYKHMKLLSENKNAAKELGLALHQWAIDHYNLDYWNKVRFDLLTSLAGK